MAKPYTEAELQRMLQRAEATGDTAAAKDIVRTIDNLDGTNMSGGNFDTLLNQIASVEGNKPNKRSSSVINTLAGLAQGALAIPDAATEAMGGIMRMGLEHVSNVAQAGANVVGRKDIGKKIRATQKSYDRVLSKPFTLGGGVEKAFPTPEDDGGVRFVSQLAGGIVAPYSGIAKLGKLEHLVNPAKPFAKAPSLKDAGPSEKLQAAKDFDVELGLEHVDPGTPTLIGRALDMQPGSGHIMQANRDKIRKATEEAAENISNKVGPDTEFHQMGTVIKEGLNRWKTRFNGKDGVAAKLYKAIKINPKMEVATPATQTKLADLADTTPSNELMSDIWSETRFQKMLVALQGKTEDVATGVLGHNGAPIMRQVKKGGSLSWEDLLALRTRIGDKMNDATMSRDISQQDLSALYKALSSDIESAAKAAGPKQYSRWKRANDNYKAGVARIKDVLEPVLGKADQQTPEKAAAIVQRISRGGRATSDIKQLIGMRKSLKNDEWNEVTSGVQRLLGQPLNSAERSFDPKTYFQNYISMSPEAKNLLFGNGALRAEMDKFSGVMENIATRKAARTIDSGGMGAGMAGSAMLTTALGALAGTAEGGMTAAAAAATALAVKTIGEMAIAKLWTSQRFVRSATNYVRAVEQGAPHTSAARERLVAMTRVMLAPDAEDQRAREQIKILTDEEILEMIGVGDDAIDAPSITGIVTDTGPEDRAAALAKIGQNDERVDVDLPTI